MAAAQCPSINYPWSHDLIGGVLDEAYFSKRCSKPSRNFFFLSRPMKGPDFHQNACY